MSRYILDTDCVSLILYNHPQLIANATKHQVAVTIVTVKELFNGWVGRINDPSLVHNLPGLYSKLSAANRLFWHLNPHLPVSRD